MSKSNATDEKSSIKYVPFSGELKEFKEWESKILAVAESQGWRHHLDFEIKTVSYKEFGLGYTDVPKNS